MQYNPSPCRVVGVFGLSLYTSEKDLKDVFGRYGKLEHVNIVYDYMVTLHVCAHLQTYMCMYMYIKHVHTCIPHGRYIRIYVLIVHPESL